MFNIINEISTFERIKCTFFIVFLFFVGFKLPAQIVMVNPIAENILFGNYNPADYTPTAIVDDKDIIIQSLMNDVSSDSLKSYLLKLESFGNRNAGSDTISSVYGIGATRKWISQKLNDFSTRNENRLVVSYLQFPSLICNINLHKNVLGVLPGLDTSLKDIVLVEAHMDSRCKGACDTTCFAPGIDDNGSGTALVIELARIMSKYAYKRTIVFTTVTGEEQGLFGGKAMAQYLFSNNIELLACLNNDVVGGVDCGTKSSPPSCSPVGSIDSVNLRLFSYSTANDSNAVSAHKQLARYIKLQQIEEINPVAKFKTNLVLQIREDRDGRGGDHIPFRQRGMRAVRFTSSNEHGNGSGTSPDRQHTPNDVLGYDLSIPPDGILDTFLINFNYLRRNTLTNAVNITLLAKSPPIPKPVYENFEFGNIEAIRFVGIDTIYNHRIGVRKNNSTDLYFDTVLTFQKNYIRLSEIDPKGDVQLHVMNLEGDIESIPDGHVNEMYLSVKKEDVPIKCMDVFPNPSVGLVNVKLDCPLLVQSMSVKVLNFNGQIVKSFDYSEYEVENEIIFDISELNPGIYHIITVINQNKMFSETLIKQ